MQAPGCQSEGQGQGTHERREIAVHDRMTELVSTAKYGRQAIDSTVVAVLDLIVMAGLKYKRSAQKWADSSWVCQYPRHWISKASDYKYSLERISIVSE